MVFCALLFVLLGGTSFAWTHDDVGADSQPGQETQVRVELKTAIDRADELAESYRATGRTELGKAQLLAHLRQCDALFGTDAEYLLAKSGYLYALDEPDLASQALALVPDAALTKPLDLVNRIRRCYVEEPDRALQLARRLARDRSSDAKRHLADWIHNSLAQAFCPVRRPNRADRLHALVDGLCTPEEPILCGMTSSLRLWVKAQQVVDILQLRAVIDVPMGGEGSYAFRYRLLLADLLARHMELQSDAFAARAKLIRELADTTETMDTVVPSERDYRAVKRYWLAYAYHAQAIAAFGGKDEVGGMDLLRLAASWSPDRRDVQSRSYLSERFALDGHAEYRSALAQRLEERGDKDGALKVRADLAKLDAKEKPALRNLHASVRPKESFERYWAEARLDDAPVAPALSLPSISGNLTTLSSFRGRWVLVDFWGTWCEPCVRDMPLVQALHRQLAPMPATGTVLTVAVDDTRQTVLAFMKARGLDFPVLMGDADTVKRFNVPHYPYRILVSPDGRYIELPSTDEWLAEAKGVLLSPDDGSRRH